MSGQDILLTTAPGLEDVAARELHAISTAAGYRCYFLAIAPWGVSGSLIVKVEPADLEADGAGAGTVGTVGTVGSSGASERRFSSSGTERGRAAHCSLVSTARSLYDALLFHGAAALPPEPLDSDEKLEAWLRAKLLPYLPTVTQSFRVTCHRSGAHAFKSVDVERLFGACILERDAAPVSLEQFDREVRIDITDRAATLGTQLNRTPLDKRYSWKYRPRVTLRTVVAYAMLDLAATLPRGASAATAGDAPASLTHPTAILDPFCGSGTILLEAAHRFPEAILVGSDYKTEMVDGARQNIEAAGLSSSSTQSGSADLPGSSAPSNALGLSGPPGRSGASSRIELEVADARDLDSPRVVRRFDLIVTNPPYGNRLHRSVDFNALYEKFLGGAWSVLKPGGRVVMLAGRRRGVLNRVLERLGLFEIAHVRVIETGGVYPGLFVLDRVDAR